MQMVFAGSNRRNHSPSPRLAPSVILPASLSRSAFNEKSIEAFINLYIPRSEECQISVSETKEFVYLIPGLTYHDEALRLAVVALGTGALGKQSSDRHLIKRSQTLYGNALMATRSALQDPVRARSTAVFVLPRIMSLFEILFGADLESSTGNKATSWLSHAEGETALITARGPEAYNTDDAAHSLFANARYRPLIASTRVRKASIFNRKEWKTLPWIGRVKTSMDSLLDIMAAIPEILESVDKDGKLSPGSSYDEARDIQTSAKCWNLHFELQDWLAANGDLIHNSAMTDTTLISFPSLETGNLNVRYWVIALLLYSSLDTATGVPPDNPEITYSDRPHPRQFARLIARSVSYFFQKDLGVAGATQISFPLGNAMLYMSRSPHIDGQYLGMITKAFADPALPSAIKSFLLSMRK
jgi:hypothetical protein